MTGVWVGFRFDLRRKGLISHCLKKNKRVNESSNERVTYRESIILLRLNNIVKWVENDSSPRSDVDMMNVGVVLDEGGVPQARGNLNDGCLVHVDLLDVTVELDALCHSVTVDCGGVDDVALFVTNCFDLQSGFSLRSLFGRIRRSFGLV